MRRSIVGKLAVRGLAREVVHTVQDVSLDVHGDEIQWNAAKEKLLLLHREIARVERDPGIGVHGGDSCRQGGHVVVPQLVVVLEEAALVRALVEGEDLHAFLRPVSDQLRDFMVVLPGDHALQRYGIRLDPEHLLDVPVHGGAVEVLHVRAVHVVGDSVDADVRQRQAGVEKLSEALSIQELAVRVQSDRAADLRRDRPDHIDDASVERGLANAAQINQRGREFAGASEDSVQHLS